MKNNKSLNYTCLFGGGAIRGIAYVGTIRALEEIGINPQNIAGSSVGSIVASLMALGYTASEMREIFLGVNFELFRDIQFGWGPNFALSKGEVFLEWIRELIEKKYYGDKYQKGKNKAVTFKDIEKNLVVITTDLSNFSCKEFSRFETPDFEIATAVRISSTMPGLMKPFEYNNTLLVDGDLQKSMPMWKLSKHLLLDEERVLEFRLEGEFDGCDKNALDYMNTIYSCITSMSTSYIVDSYGNNDKFDYVVIKTGDVIVVDFNYPKEKREELIESGYRQTIEYFSKQLPDKKNQLIKKYYNIRKQLIKVQKLLSSNKILKAKHALAEIFIPLCDDKDIIDKKIFNSIKEFHATFSDNIKYPALFGKISIKHDEEVQKQLKELILLILEKVYELEAYLIKFPI
ncbi:MAG: hypothetical protein E7Z93_05215 [Cyanobacteria bacterium SIG32]|nr:hypothetical protein [Cyanobacteria bacterium SIG32]